LRKLRLDQRDIQKQKPASGVPVRPEARELASGDGWSVRDIVCTAGPADRPFEEQHSVHSIAIVVAGTFQYRTSTGRELMTPGSLLLGNAGDCFTCGHEHGTGDRCLSFSYTRDFCDQLADSAGIVVSRFRTPRLAPLRELSPLVANAAGVLAGADSAQLEELAHQLLARTLQIGSDDPARRLEPDPSSLARVTRVIRMIDAHPETAHDLTSLAGIARLSAYHFLRVFERLTGTTPHQYLLRMRLRRAATRVRQESGKILDIALDCGFADVSNFNRMFRAEFGVSPRAWRSMA
jgi:AraC-like DNA-binding protein